MKINLLLFTQTMHSLLLSSLTLQDALLVSKEILSGKNDKTLSENLYNKINEGKRFAAVLSEYNEIFPKIFISLVGIGEESGTLPQVFGRLSDYIKNKRTLRQKIFQALAYPLLVLITAIIVIFVLMLFVMPRLEGIFMAFTESSEDIGQQMVILKNNLSTTGIITAIVIILFLGIFIVHKFNKKAAYAIDSAILKLPFIGKIITTMQIYDFSFAMKLLSATHFPLVESLKQAGLVLKNRRLQEAVFSVSNNIARGRGVGEAFDSEGVFPKYLTVWIKIAEKNGRTDEAFSQICDYYSSENENILAGIIAFAEPFFILVTGIIIICIISQFVVPVFNLLGAL